MTDIIDKYDDLEILNIISEARNFTLSELVFRKIRSMILNGEILSGDKIHENNISDELNVSRGPVREATRRLSQIGLLEYTAQKGLKVKKFNINEIEELYEISISLCKLSGKLIYKNINTKIIDELEIMFNSFNQISQKDYKNNYYLSSLKFSENIWKLTKNNELYDIYTHHWQKRRICRIFLISKYNQFKNMYEFNKSLFYSSIKNRSLLMDAIKNPDQNFISKILEKQLHSSKIKTLNLFKGGNME